MKVRQRIFVDLCLFLACFVAAATILYKGVYTEGGDSSDGGLVLISEIKPTGGVGKSNDEFIELYNPNTGPVIIGGWVVDKMTKSASSTDRQHLFVFPLGTVIPSQAHILVAHVDSSVSSLANYLYTGQTLSDDNTVVLVDNTGVIIDLVGYGLAKNVETEAAYAPSSQLLSIERKPGGELGNGHDTNNNKLDWFRVQSSPQNLQSLLVPEVAVPVQVVPTSTSEVTNTEPIEDNVQATSTLDTVTLVPAATSTVDSLTTSLEETISTAQTNSSSAAEVSAQSNSATSSQYLMGSILITELYPMPKSGESEFVELLNRTPQSIDVTGWYLIDGGGTKTMVSGTLFSMHYLVIEKPKGSLNNAGDVVSLIAPNETIIDTVSYGEWDDGTPGNNAPSAQTGLSIVRIHDTEDSNLDYFDFGLSTTSTKGMVNIYTSLPLLVDKEDEETEATSGVSSAATSSTKVTVKKAGPLYPRIIYQATTTVGTEIFFDASLSTGGEGVRQYIWEMDDGTILRGGMVGHVYLLPDTYSVVLTVFDNTGTEKHKTVKVTVVPNPGLEIEKKVVQTKEMSVVAAKTTTKKVEPAVVFTQISELPKIKTNSLVRIRGVLASVFITKTSPEFYFVSESSSGGVTTGVLIKTKSAMIDARVGDVVELSGKFILNSTSGNYIQYTADDQLSIVGSGEVLVPISASIKSAAQLFGGYVQIQGEIVEKKPSYSIVSDSTGEIKLIGELGEELKIRDQIIAIGYILRTKEGSIIRVGGANDITHKKVAVTSTAPETTETLSNPERPITTFVLIGLIGSVLLGLVIKKFWLKKNGMIEATEI